MGAAMAQRLLNLGHVVTVWNRSPAKTQPLAEACAKVAPSARELPAACELVISILTDAAAIDATYRGESGLLAGDVKGRLFVEMSTVRPHVQEKLGEELRARGASLIDCPVGGSTVPARDGKLLGFVGGDASDVARAKPVL